MTSLVFIRVDACCIVYRAQRGGKVSCVGKHAIKCCGMLVCA